MMSFRLFFATLILTILSIFPDVAFSRVVPRKDAPAGYDTTTLEAYSTYHTRYLALNCQNQHGTTFFDDCCHPLLANETASAECTPSSSALASASAAEATEDATAAATTTTVINAELFSTTTTSTTTNNAQAWTPTTTSSTAASTSTSSDSTVYTGGYGTYFYQNDVAGACGTVHSDTDYIVALDSALYGDTAEESSLCGKSLTITNTANSKSVTATVADACPTCENSSSLDLSVATFEAIADLSTGEINIEWSFN